MDLKKFNKLFDKLLKSKRKRKLLFRSIKSFYKKKLLSNNQFLVFFKILILILFYYPKKYKCCIEIIKLFELLEIKNRQELLNLLELFNNTKIKDYLKKKIILNTFNLLYSSINFENVFIIWKSILLSVKKIKNYSNYIKIKIYLQIIKESINLSDRKIFDLSLNTIKLFNQI